MKLIEWNEEVTSDLGQDVESDIFFKVLAGNITDCWKGKIRRGKMDEFYAPLIELRKTFWSAQVLIKIGYRKTRLNKGTLCQDNQVSVSMSMNGTASMKSTDFIEMNIAVQEAMSVLEHIKKDK